VERDLKGLAKPTPVENLLTNPSAELQRPRTARNDLHG